MEGTDYYYLIVFTLLLVLHKEGKDIVLILTCLIFSLFSQEIQVGFILSGVNENTGQILSDLIFLICVCPFIRLPFNNKVLIPLAILTSILVNLLYPFENTLGDFLYNNYEQINTLLFELIIMGCINKQVIQDTLNKVKITLISLYRKLLSPYKLTYLKYPYHLERFMCL